MMLGKLSVRNPVLWAWLRGCASTLIVVVVAVLAFVLVAIVEFGPGGETVLVPNVVEQTQAEACKRLARVGLEGYVTAHNYHPSIPEGCVISTAPRALVPVRVGRRVKLVISSGPRQISVPELVGRTLAEANRFVEDAGLVVDKSVRRHSDQPIGQVISQSPAAGKKLPHGKAIDLVISGGPDFGRLNGPDGQVVLLRQARVVVPAGRSAQRVRITLNYRYGSKPIYDRIHRQGEEIVVDFTASPSDRIEVYIDGELVKRERL